MEGTYTVRPAVTAPQQWATSGCVYAVERPHPSRLEVVPHREVSHMMTEVRSPPVPFRQLAVPPSPVLTGGVSGVSRACQRQEAPSGKPKKLRSFSAKAESWEVYKTHLDLVARLNRWDESITLEHFCSELSGEAQEFYCSIGLRDRENY